jgi:hypothetical protein
VDLGPRHIAGAAFAPTVYPVKPGTRSGTLSAHWSDAADVTLKARDTRDDALLAAAHVKLGEPERVGLSHDVRVRLTATGVRRLRRGRHTVRLIVWANATRLIYPVIVIGE